MPFEQFAITLLFEFFIYINNKSQKINKAREILLDNEDINSVAVQELVQTAHDNDIDKDENQTIDISSVPLVIFDWRGEEKHGRPIKGPASIFSVEEVKGWCKEYFLGDIKQKNSEILSKFKANLTIYKETYENAR